VLFPTAQYSIRGNPVGYDVRPDGRGFVLTRPVTGAGEIELVVVQNWFEELKARAGSAQ
jgi:hypothetical protein